MKFKKWAHLFFGILRAKLFGYEITNVRLEIYDYSKRTTMGNDCIYTPYVIDTVWVDILTKVI